MRLRPAFAALLSVVIVSTGVGTATASEMPVAVDEPADLAGARWQPPVGARGDQVGRIRWWRCTDIPGIQCGSMRVPKFWSNPSAGTIELALARLRPLRRASNAPTVFVNPGGPGGSGTDFVINGYQSFAKLRTKYNVIGWDPRGVPTSSPVPRNCIAFPGPERLRPQFGAFTWQGVTSVRFAQTRKQLSQCIAINRQLNRYVGTNLVVQDLEAMRQAVGDRKLTYLGFSYGTTIGRTYAIRYPSRVRAMVLDGLTEPESSQLAYTRNQVGGSSRGWAMVYGSLPAGVRQVYREVVAYLQAATISIGGMSFNRWTTWSAAINTLRSASARRDLGQFACALGDAISVTSPDCAGFTQQATTVARRAQRMLRIAVGSPILQLVNCQDRSQHLSAREVGGFVQRAARVSGPEAASNVLNYGAACGGTETPSNPIPALSSLRLPLPALLVNGVGDIATPYRDALQTRQRMPGSRLVTVNTTAHGISLLQGSRCVDRQVLRYLLQLRLPATDMRCPAFP